MQFDPALAELLVRDADAIFDGLDAVGQWQSVIAAEPSLAVLVSGEELDAALAAVATAVDIKSPYWLGHAQAVADLAAGAAEQLGLPEAEVRTCVEQVSSTALAGWRVELDLGRAWSPRNRRLGACPHAPVPDRANAPPVRGARPTWGDCRSAARAPRRVRIPSRAVWRRDQPARAAAGAADAYQAMREPRAHRRELSRDEAAAQLRADVTARCRDAEAVDAVLAAAGHRVSRRREGPAGLTPREVEVLKLLAQGLSNKQIAQRLTISPKTAGSHVEHIYSKIETSSRAAASLFAVQHGLLPTEENATAA